MDDLIVEREFSKDAAAYLCRKAMEYFVPGVEDYMEIAELLLGCAESIVQAKLKEDEESAKKCGQLIRDAKNMFGLWQEKQLCDPAAAINAAEVLAELAKSEPDAERYRRAARFILESEVLDGKRLRDFIEQCEELLREEPTGTQEENVEQDKTDSEKETKS